MADQIPFFLTGANARILLNSKTMAFATDVSYRITVKHASPRVLGRYEVEVHQPLAYDVAGTLTIIRYARGLKDHYGSGVPKDVNNDGNGIGSMGLSAFGGPIGSALGLPTADGQWDGKANEAFNPSRFFQSSMFNIEIRQKIVGKELKIGNASDTEASIILIRDCRMEELAFTLNKKGVATQTFTFKARYVDDDTFIARKSGVGQELS